jgi:hypothetical protein
VLRSIREKTFFPDMSRSGMFKSERIAKRARTNAGLASSSHNFVSGEGSDSGESLVLSSSESEDDDRSEESETSSDSGSDVDVISSDVLSKRKSADLPIPAGAILYAHSRSNIVHIRISLNLNRLECGRAISSAYSRRKVSECGFGLRCIPCFNKI